MKLASIETISAVAPHSNADRLELATVLGWQTIVKRGEFKVGDRVVLVVIDTILPDAEWSEFLKDGDKPIRLKTIRLRGEWSQGLVLPLSVLPEHMRTWQIGADVGGELGIKKYEKEIPAQLSGTALGAFPTYVVSKTDEDNALSNLDLVQHVLSLGPVCVTQKLDGSSMTVIVEFKDLAPHVRVCSRNLELADTDGNSFWRVARKLDFSDLAFAAARINSQPIVLQGELMGPGIQGNQLGLMEPELYLFQVRDHGSWMTPNGVKMIAQLVGCKSVPVIDHHWKDASLHQLMMLADNQTLPNGKPAEGIVVRPFYTPASGTGRPLGFKIINRNYKD